jgi:hypothetical protein
MVDSSKLVDNSIKVINSTSGRDKMCRIFQYFTKFLLPVLAAQGDRYKTLHTKCKSLN